MVVQDSQTRVAITEFAYTYRIKTSMATYDPLLVRPLNVRSAQGKFSLLAPPTCEIELHLEAGAIIGGYPVVKNYVLTADNKQRQLEVPVDTGATVEGVVVDSGTKRPIANALVSPIVFSPPILRPDRDRSVKTDAQGRFRIRGISPNLWINVWHPDYLDCNPSMGQKAGDKLFVARVELKPGEVILGAVKDISGKSLADVNVSDGTGKSVQTRADGSFSLRGPNIWGSDQTYHVLFEKEGYLRKELLPKPPVGSPLSVVLEQQPSLTGRVFGPDGQPVTQFTVFAGPGPEPRGWCCLSQTVSASDSQFSVRVRTDFGYDTKGKVWMAVKAPGFAIWETVTDSWRGAKTIAVPPLKPGVSIRGTIKEPGNLGLIVANLLPTRLVEESSTREISQRQELGRMQAAVDGHGAFRFDHVGPGRYLLAIAGPRISPISTAFEVGASNVDVGTLVVRGRGSVVGMVYEPKMICEAGKCRLDPKRNVWAFAEGHVSFSDSSGRSNADEFDHFKPIPFKTDERGRFRLYNVPIGDVDVSFPY
jgi:hypothetical protein